MDNIVQRLRIYIVTHPFDPGESNYDMVLDQLYQIYQESHENDPPEIRNGFKDLAELLKGIPLRDNDAVFNLCCAFAPPTNIKHSWTVCNTAQI